MFCSDIFLSHIYHCFEYVFFFLTFSWGLCLPFFLNLKWDDFSCFLFFIFIQCNMILYIFNSDVVVELGKIIFLSLYFFSNNKIGFFFSEMTLHDYNLSSGEKWKIDLVHSIISYCNITKTKDNNKKFCLYYNIIRMIKKTGEC